MMLTQEELNQLFPKEEIPIDERRYCIGWYHEGTREFIIVFDKKQKHIVFKSNTSILYDKEGNIVLDENGKVLTRQRQYYHIQKFYGKNDCQPPKQINPQFYEGL